MKNKLFYIILFGLIFLIFYQDFPFVNLFGEIARSPIVFLCPFFIIYILSQKNITLSKNAYYLFIFIIILSFLSILNIGLIYFNTGSLEVLNENIITKTLKMAIYPIVILIFYIFCYSLFKNTKNINEYLFKIFYKLQVFYLIFLIIEIIYLSKSSVFLPFLFSSSEKYFRIRLLTYEESWTGSVIVLLTFFPIFLMQKVNIHNKLKVYSTSILLFLIYILQSQSKGFLLLILISVFPMLFYSFLTSKGLYRLKLVVLPLLFLGVVFLSYSFINLVLDQLYSSVTFGTRFTSILAGLKVFIEYPLGTGWPGINYNYPLKINEIVSNDLMDDFKLFEIRQYINNSKNLSTKSFFLDHLIQGGLFFLIFFYLFFVRIYLNLFKLKHTLWLKIIVLYVILAGVIFITYHIKYEIWFIIAYVEFLLNKKDQNEKNLNSL